MYCGDHKESMVILILISKQSFKELGFKKENIWNHNGLIEVS